MQILVGRGGEDLSRAGRHLSDGRGARSEDHDVEFGFKSGDKVIVQFKFGVEGERCFPAAFEALCELTTTLEWKQSLRSPERGCSGAGPGTFKTDFAKVQFGRAEIGVGRIVFVEAPDIRIAKENAAAAVRLQAVLVGIDDDGVDFTDFRAGAGGVCGKI